MRQAFDKLQSEFGQSMVDQYQKNARSIINGENVPINEIRKLKKKKRFWLF
jgi:protein-tyrosine phosphatase